MCLSARGHERPPLGGGPPRWRLCRSLVAWRVAGCFITSSTWEREPSKRWAHFFDGVLSETEHFVRFFSASTGGDVVPRGAERPWIFHFDPLEYIGETVLGGHTIIGPKRHYLSIFFTSADAACDGKNKSQWTFEETSQALPGHVYVEDGTLETRRDAFVNYHFSVICMAGAAPASLLPQAVVDAVGFGCHPLVPTAYHERLQRVFFHLPDAVQPFIRMHPLILETYLDDMYNNPEKNDAMYYKQTFLFLMMDLFRYRYRQDRSLRLKSFACALCHQRAGADARDEAVSVDTDEALSAAHIITAFCLMSRRSGHALREAIRKTWAQRLGPGSTLRFFVGRQAEGGAVAGAGLVDWDAEDLVTLDAPESYEAVTLKAMSMLHWAREHFPRLRYLIRADDDVYLRPAPLLRQLHRRPPVGYLWGNFDSGSTVVRDETHPHYNSEEQLPIRDHPMFGDIFPPYVRGHLWAMSHDLLTHVADWWAEQLDALGEAVSLELAKRLPHPDDPALGVAIAQLVDRGLLSVAVDDRDLNHFALNPSCNATYLNIHNRTWVVHHVTPQAMECFWSIDEQFDPLELPDLCACSMEVVEEKSGNEDDDDFDYPRHRFNE
ncbi:unnamed protein product [Durusdinium trenchii]|uniref:Hexosyltransferase n=1 Tax=Durusdinium trenchii TaxID=1381693 RepID=A0ABP0K0X0_9DINO